MKIYTFLMISLFITIFACQTTKQIIPYQRTGEVIFVKQPSVGTVVLESNAYASDRATGIFYAEKNVFENLFFKGIPGSPQQTPMIPDEEKAIYGHRNFFKRFFNSNEYRKYTIESVLVDEKKNSSGVMVTQEITIDLDALRKLLKKEQIIKDVFENWNKDTQTIVVIKCWVKNKTGDKGVLYTRNYITHNATYLFRKPNLEFLVKYKNSVNEVDIRMLLDVINTT